MSFGVSGQAENSVLRWHYAGFRLASGRELRQLMFADPCAGCGRSLPRDMPHQSHRTLLVTTEVRVPGGLSLAYSLLLAGCVWRYPYALTQAHAREPRRGVCQWSPPAPAATAKDPCRRSVREGILAPAVLVNPQLTWPLPPPWPSSPGRTLARRLITC